MGDCWYCAMGLVPRNGSHSIATDAGYETVPCVADGTIVDADGDVEHAAIVRQPE